MIDLHCHILPAIDDGARDLDDAIAMARRAERDGVELVCATPHIRHDHDVRIAELGARSRELEVELRKRGIGVRIDPAGEVAETAVESLEHWELQSVAYGAGHWLLVEPRPGPLSDTLDSVVEHLAERGFRVLIAHPERHLGEGFFERLAGLVERGCLVQATADFFVHEPMAGGMAELARRGLVHVLGSDSHSSRAGRPLALSPALERLAGVEPLSSHLGWIRATAPGAITRGEDVEPPYRVEI